MHSNRTFQHAKPQRNSDGFAKDAHPECCTVSDHARCQPRLTHLLRRTPCTGHTHFNLSRHVELVMSIVVKHGDTRLGPAKTSGLAVRADEDARTESGWPTTPQLKHVKRPLSARQSCDSYPCDGRSGSSRAAWRSAVRSKTPEQKSGCANNSLFKHTVSSRSTLGAPDL